MDVEVDAAGNIFFADFKDCRVRKIDVDGMMTTVAGTGIPGFAGDGGPATDASLAYPDGLALDGLGNIYISDMGNNRIRKVDTNGIITTVVGSGSYGFRGDGGPAWRAWIAKPFDIEFGPDGSLYVADNGNFRVRRVDPSGIVTTVAGNGQPGYGGDHGPAVQAALKPAGLAFDAIGRLAIADSYAHRVRLVDEKGTISTVAGNGTLTTPAIATYHWEVGRLIAPLQPVPGLSGDAIGDGGPATAASLAYPQGVAFDRLGNLFVFDAYHNRVRRIEDSGTITTVVGNGWLGYSGDGQPAIEASLSQPARGVVDSRGYLIIADLYNHRLRRVDPPFKSAPSVVGPFPPPPA